MRRGQVEDEDERKKCRMKKIVKSHLTLSENSEFSPDVIGENKAKQQGEKPW